MPNQVLIVAPAGDAASAAELASALDFVPVIALSEQDALALLAKNRFEILALSETQPASLRQSAAALQPWAELITLPSSNGKINKLREALISRKTSAEETISPERFRSLSRILESFTATLDLQEVLRRIVTMTREAFGADRAFLIRPVSPGSGSATVTIEDSDPRYAGTFTQGRTIPLDSLCAGPASATGTPIVSTQSDGTLAPQFAADYSVQSQMLDLLKPRDEEAWIFGLHQCSEPRRWTEEERRFFAEIGRYATIALSNTLLHERAVREMAKVSAILDQIPESAAIYDASGRLERMNAAAMRDASQFFSREAEVRLKDARQQAPEANPLGAHELPSMRALRGETVRSDYLVHGPRSDDDRVVNLKAAPIRDDRGNIVGSVVLSRDVTEERQVSDREASRRRRADALAALGLDFAAGRTTFDNLNDTAALVAQTIGGTAFIYLYHPASGHLDLTGYAPATPETDRFVDYVKHNPFRPGEGLPGTVFQIGRPLFFSEVRGNDVVDFGRTTQEKELKAFLLEQTVIASPIESYGDRIGALVISRSERGRNFDAEDLEFAQSVAERIGAASHIQRLTRISQEGHRAAEELARREVDARVRLEGVLESAPIGIAVVSADELRFEVANPRWHEFASMYGKIASDTKVIGLRAAEVIPGFEQILKQVADTGEPRVDEAFKVTGASSLPTYFNRIISPVRGRFSGITQSITVLVQDVTDQVRAKREIEDLAQMMEERSARLDSILGSMVDGLWVYDAQGNVVDVNQAALTMFGLGSRTEAVQQGSFASLSLRYPDGRPIPRADFPYSRALRGQVVPDYLAIGKHLITGKDLDLSIAAAPIESNGVVGAVLVVRDITALQELDRKKDEFLSVASHELRTPLTTIKGYTQLLAQTVNDVKADERITYLQAVLGEIERMMGLISELLDVSRIETNRLQIHPQSVDWVEFIERRASAFRVQNTARTIHLQSDAPQVVLNIDPDRMRQVVDNLLSNALKYSGEKTDVHLRVRVNGQWVETAIIDRGIGIPRDEIPQLFERFHRARNVSSRYYGGLGLGLYIAKAIVEVHGGRIIIDSEEGKGATFTISLPLNGPVGAADSAS